MKPMLAAAISDINALRYPVYISGKLDGVRILKLDGKIVTRTLKPLPNIATRKWLEQVLPDGADGEIICGTLPETMSAVMTHQGEPKVQYYWFDWMLPGEKFLARQELMRKHHQGIKDPNIIFWESIPCASVEYLLEAERTILKAGLEGVMVRHDGPYKHGRSTLNEGYLLKLKRFHDAEARIVGFQELRRNQNVAWTNALGHSERAQLEAGMIEGNTLGALLVQDLTTGIFFGIGSGFTMEQRDAIWAAKETWLGKIVIYKSQPFGAKDAPRFPIFLCERNPLDMSA
jgi:DNA ligase 1